MISPSQWLKSGVPIPVCAPEFLTMAGFSQASPLQHPAIASRRVHNMGLPQALYFC
jgi:hypothetical protein